MDRGILVHEWLAQTGGSENVFDAMVQAFPEADLLCLWSDREDRYPGRSLQETWLARTPLRRSKVLALPFMPATWRHGQRPGYDWALVSSHLFAHHFLPADRSDTFRKYVYVHSPARYIWHPDLDTRGGGLLPRAVAPALRRLDRSRAREAAAIAANSAFVRDRVRSAWDTDAVVIHPPVDVATIQSRVWSDALVGEDRSVFEALPRPFLLGASRFVEYKRLDLVIEAGSAVGLPVVIAGSGPDRGRLEHLAAAASVPVTFVERPSDALLYALYEEASVFVFPGIEDFGIMPVEALASGTPVVVGPEGGAKESVVVDVTGAVAEELTPSALAAAVQRALACRPDACRAGARRFDGPRFADEVRQWVLA